jgi:hypothetical protein
MNVCILHEEIDNKSLVNLIDRHMSGDHGDIPEYILQYTNENFSLSYYKEKDAVLLGVWGDIIVMTADQYVQLWKKSGR